MSYSFHPAAEAEFLESVAYYELKVPGLGAALIDEIEALAQLIHDFPKSWQVELKPISAGRLCTSFLYLLSTEKRQQGYKF